jgi:hypothetical protein
MLLGAIQEFFACVIQDKIEQPLALTEKGLLDRFFESGIKDSV